MPITSSTSSTSSMSSTSSGWQTHRRFGDQTEIVKEANKFNLGPGGLLICLANKNEYAVWINADAGPGSGQWHHFNVENDADVATELNKRGVKPGNATVTVNGDNSRYIVLYYA